MFKGNACFFTFDFYWQNLFHQGTTLSNIWHFLRKNLNFKSKKILRNFNMWEYVISIWNICSNRTVLNNKIYQKKSSVNIFYSRNEYKEKQVNVFFRNQYTNAHWSLKSSVYAPKPITLTGNYITCSTFTHTACLQAALTIVTHSASWIHCNYNDQIKNNLQFLY